MQTSLIIWLISITFFSSCSQRNHVLQIPRFRSHFSYNQAQEIGFSTDTEHEIIIFIHGTVLGIPSLILRDLSFRFKTPYAYQPIDEIGFHKISLSNKKNIGALLAAHNYQRMHQSIYGKKKNLHFYTHGWDGFLSEESRKKAGETLYLSLVEERNKIQKLTDKRVEITIQGHSHGGNVIAYLKDFEMQYQKKLRIDRVGLWGTPIQEETAHHWAHDMFTRVYHCYSQKDRVMTLDILSTKRHRSYRRFDKICTIPDKLSQVELRVNNMHPTHAELWFLGCINRFLYRRDFGLYPFPCIHLAPAIFHAVDVLEKENKNLIININNQQNAYLLEVTPHQTIDQTITDPFEYNFQYDLMHAEPLQVFGPHFINASL